MKCSRNRGLGSYTVLCDSGDRISEQKDRFASVWEGVLGEAAGLDENRLHPKSIKSA